MSGKPTFDAYHEYGRVTGQKSDCSGTIVSLNRTDARHERAEVGA